MTDTVDISTLSSDEMIDHIIKMLCKEAEGFRSDEVQAGHATLLAMLHTARSLDQIEYRMFHIINALEGIRASLEKRP